MGLTISLSAAQEDMLAGVVSRGEATSLWLPSSVLFDDEPDIPKLEASVRALIDRHAALRMRLVRKQGLSLRDVRDVDPWIIDWSTSCASSTAEAHDRVRVALESDYLVDRPLFGCFINLVGEGWMITLAAHHLVVDGLSLEILWQDLDRFYNGGANQTSGNPSSTCAIVESCMREELFITPERSIFPPCREPSVLQRHSIDIRATTWLAARKAGLTLGATPFSVLLAAYVGSLARSYHLSRVVVGAPIDRRPQELANEVGFFIESCALEMAVEPSATAATLCVLACAAIVGALTSKTWSRHSGGFDFWIAMHPSGGQSGRSLGPLVGRESVPAWLRARHPIRLDVSLGVDSLSAEIGRDANRVGAADADSIALDMVSFCEQLAERPNAPLTAWRFEREAEHARLREEVVDRVAAARFTIGAGSARPRSIDGSDGRQTSTV